MMKLFYALIFSVWQIAFAQDFSHLTRQYYQDNSHQITDSKIAWMEFSDRVTNNEQLKIFRLCIDRAVRNNGVDQELGYILSRSVELTGNPRIMALRVGSGYYFKFLRSVTPNIKQFLRNEFGRDLAIHIERLAFPKARDVFIRFWVSVAGMKLSPAVEGLFHHYWKHIFFGTDEEIAFRLEALERLFPLFRNSLDHNNTRLILLDDVVLTAFYLLKNSATEYYFDQVLRMAIQAEISFDLARIYLQGIPEFVDDPLKLEVLNRIMRRGDHLFYDLILKERGERLKRLDTLTKLNLTRNPEVAVQLIETENFENLLEYAKKPKAFWDHYFKRMVVAKKYYDIVDGQSRDDGIIRVMYLQFLEENELAELPAIFKETLRDIFRKQLTIRHENLQIGTRCYFEIRRFIKIMKEMVPGKH